MGWCRGRRGQDGKSKKRKRKKKLGRKKEGEFPRKIHPLLLSLPLALTNLHFLNGRRVVVVVVVWCRPLRTVITCEPFDFTASDAAASHTIHYIATFIIKNGTLQLFAANTLGAINVPLYNCDSLRQCYDREMANKRIRFDDNNSQAHCLMLKREEESSRLRRVLWGHLTSPTPPRVWQLTLSKVEPQLSRSRPAVLPVALSYLLSVSSVTWS